MAGQFTRLPALQTNAPVGSATAANQVLEIAQLTQIDANQTNGTQVTQITGTVPLPTGSATAANQTTQIAAEQATQASVASIDTKTPALGQALAAASVPVVLTAAQLSTLTPLSTVAVSNFPATQPVSGTVAATQSGTWNITNVSGTVSLPTGAATAANQATEISSLATIATNTTNAGTPVVSGTVAVSNFPATQPVSGTVTANAGTNLNTSALALETGGNLASINTKVPALGQALAAASVPVVLTAAQLSTLTPLTTVATTAAAATTSSVTSVASSGSSVSLLASNSSRKNATFFNESTTTLYLKLGATASFTSYTVQLSPNSYYELPNGAVYTGAIDGIWSSANGSARITELS